ncbi:calcium-binding protein [Agrobacterium sp. rho-13.3]|uniref:calcium-binding protein n=1 Tax=Agrobacterium sp. rho-13.3 TaxID=3072980 RepID=UPI002A158024|nr:hypothetical protein [Agrobacterium sp. rho-13.3]MDX8306834.1 hypothetical protein [Agrobacterium sp. rho-13.3]MDX8306835.1 hypothetical protein [Agrobacterium sp. rho-13.3]
MTYISNSFANGVAMQLFMTSRNASSNQGAVDKIIELVRASTRQTPSTTDIYAPFDGAQIDTRDGNESDDPHLSIDAFNDARIFTGGGNDSIGAYRRAVISSGSGNDYITTDDKGVVDSGSGDDYVYGNSYMTVNAGEGNDEVRTDGYSSVDAGDGDDVVVTLGYSRVDGGAGNDTLIAVDNTADHSDQAGHAVLNGGEGDDDIQIGRNSVANGGTGNDKITLVRGGSTVEFARGDGQDRVFAADDFALAISGYSKNDVSVTKQDGNIIISFAGSQDTITVNLPDEKAIQLSFNDGTEMTINGADESLKPTFNVKWTSPEWTYAEAYKEFEYSTTNADYTLYEERLEINARMMSALRVNLAQ